MITSPAFAGKTYGVYGLARSGKASVAALTASGASTLNWDDGEAARAAFDGPLTNLHDHDLASLDALIVSPGVPPTAPLFAKAVAAGIPVIGDTELFAQARADLPPHRVVGITGTNGKSTTTALVHHILKFAGVPALMGGNIGLPILAQDPLPDGGVYVLELSSYQIDITFSLDCDVAVLLNVTPDHLERHGSFEAYRAAKIRLFGMQSHDHCGIIATQDPEIEAIILDMVEGPGNWQWRRNIGVQTSYPDQGKWPALQGPHNAQNVSAALGVCFELGVQTSVALAALETYPGLPHRLERLAEKSGVLWVNDSKATNPQSTAPALAAFPRIHWIAGGRAKGADLDAVLPYLGGVVAVYLIGEAASTFAAILAPHIPVHLSGTLGRAVAEAAAAAKPGDTVLLSPACASFDQFRDFEARGDCFRAQVEALP